MDSGKKDDRDGRGASAMAAQAGWNGGKKAATQEREGEMAEGPTGTEEEEPRKPNRREAAMANEWNRCQVVQDSGEMKVLASSCS